MSDCDNCGRYYCVGNYGCYCCFDCEKIGTEKQNELSYKELCQESRKEKNLILAEIRNEIIEMKNNQNEINLKLILILEKINNKLDK
jgi:hypothetical protein